MGKKRIEFEEVDYNPIHLSYLAGIVDGEGCFCITKCNNPEKYGCTSPKYSAQLRISNTKEELFHWINDKSELTFFPLK